MIANRIGCLLMVAAVSSLLTGCASPKHDMSDMKPPERAAELDKLDAFAGNWEFNIQMTMEGQNEPFACTGTSYATWECDRRLLVERVEGDMGEMGKFHGLGIYTWDPQDKVFRTFWFSNMGEMEHGTMRYDEATHTWTMKGEGQNLVTGERTRGKGTCKASDANTMEWTGAQYDSWGWTKKMEMKGTSKRK